MRRLRAVSIGCAIALGASLPMARVHPFGDAGLYAAKGTRSIMTNSSVPVEVRATLAAKCADCHSMQTRAPFYGRLAPISWLMERDIVKGRRYLNLSLWDTYSADQQQTLKAKIVRETKAHEMPLLQYQVIHRNTRITDADIRTFVKWSAETSIVQAGSAGGPILEGDAVRGRAVFEKRCTGCHSMTQDREGPRLEGVFGRASGTVAGFAYSPALKKAHLVWDEASLEQWLTDPDTLVPDNNMGFHVAKPQERLDLISFLKQESGK
ncbi:MAG: heme-binding domain-containing protein [Silvibacterium sp.]